jgi:Bacterial SCP ortholog
MRPDLTIDALGRSAVFGGTGEEVDDALVLNLVLVADDLSRSLPTPANVEIDRNALRVAVRYLLDNLSAKAPGHTVEVRVPPIAAVQCVEGPRHTRGTPPNVVELDPLSWVRLATGRTTWEFLVRTGALRASGSRSDISDLLPLA